MRKFLTYGDTNEPDVSEQLEPISRDLTEIYAQLRTLTQRLAHVEKEHETLLDFVYRAADRGWKQL